MSPGNSAGPLTTTRESPVPHAPEIPSEHSTVFATAGETMLAHREKITAAIPGCTCGKSFPEGSWDHYALLHAQHVADQVVIRVLGSAIAAIRVDREDYARDPARWGAGGHDSAAAIDAIVNMGAREGGQSRPKETPTP